MPSEYKPATVTSGDVRARISGDLVSLSGETIVATVSGQPVTLVKYEEAEDGTVIQGTTIPKLTQLTYVHDDANSRWIRWRALNDADGIASPNVHPLVQAQSLGFNDTSWQRLRTVFGGTTSGTQTLAGGLMAHDAAVGLLRRLETIASGEPILAVGHASGTRLISVSSQLISSGGQTYTGAALTFALGKYTAFALYNSVSRSGASGQTVATQIQFSDDAATNWYDLVDGPFGALLYEGVQVGAGTLRDVQTGKVAGPDVRVFVRTSGSTLNGSNNFTLSSFVMLLNN